MATSMTKADRSAFEDAKREANYVITSTEPRSAWIGTVVGVVIGIAALVWLLH